jgi:hypothetical protein
MASEKVEDERIYRVTGAVKGLAQQRRTKPRC